MIVRECVEKQFEGSLKNKKFILNMNACDIWNNNSNDIFITYYYAIAQLYGYKVEILLRVN